MKRFHKLLLLGFNILYVVIGLTLANPIIDHSKNYQNEMEEHVKVLQFQDRLLNSNEWLILLTSNYVDVEDYVWQEKLIKSQKHLNSAEDSKNDARDAGQLLIIYLLIGLLLNIFLFYKIAGLKKSGVLSTIGASLILAYVGIFTPMLEIHAYNENLEIPVKIDVQHYLKQYETYLIEDSNGYLSGIDLALGMVGIDIELAEYIKEIDIPNKLDIAPVHYFNFEGRTYYYYQCKSIANIIGLLIQDKNYIVAFSIIIFSIGIPIIKATISILMLISAKVGNSSSLHKVLGLISKWSMADVFVASAFFCLLYTSDAADD